MSPARKNPEVERLERELAQLRQSEDARRKGPGDFPVLGCSDNSCEVRAPGGMGTNGGCRCEARELRRALRWWRRKAEFLETTIREMRDSHAAAEVKWNRQMVDRFEHEQQ